MADNSSMEFDHYGNKNLNSSSYFSFLLCILSTFLDQPLRRLIKTVAPVYHADRATGQVFQTQILLGFRSSLF